MEEARAVARDMLGMGVCGGLFLARVLCAPGGHEAPCDMSSGDLAHRLQEDCEGCQVIPEVTLIQEQALKVVHRLADLLLLKGCIWLLAPGCELPAEAFPSDRHHRRLQRMAELVVRLEGEPDPEDAKKLCALADAEHQEREGMTEVAHAILRRAATLLRRAGGAEPDQEQRRRFCRAWVNGEHAHSPQLMTLMALMPARVTRNEDAFRRDLMPLLDENVLPVLPRLRPRRRGDHNCTLPALPEDQPIVQPRLFFELEGTLSTLAGAQMDVNRLNEALFVMHTMHQGAVPVHYGMEHPYDRSGVVESLKWLEENRISCLFLHVVLRQGHYVLTAIPYSRGKPLHQGYHFDSLGGRGFGASQSDVVRCGLFVLIHARLLYLLADKLVLLDADGEVAGVDEQRLRRYFAKGSRLMRAMGEHAVTRFFDRYVALLWSMCDASVPWFSCYDPLSGEAEVVDEEGRD